MAKLRFVLENSSDEAELNISVGNVVHFKNTQFGNPFNIQAGTSGFTVSTPVNGSDSIREESKAITTAGTTLGGKYIQFFSGDNTQFYLWYNTGADPDPAPGGTGIEVAINASDPSYLVASKTRIAIYKRGEFELVNNGYSSTLPITNIQEESRSKIFRSSNITGTESNFEIYGVMPISRNNSAMIIGSHNFTSGVKYRLRLFSTITPDNSPTYDSGELTITAATAGSILHTWSNSDTWGSFAWGSEVLPDDIFEPGNNLILWMPTEIATASKSFLLTIDIGTSSGQNTFDIGRLIIGPYFEVTYNFSYGHSLEWSENTKQYRTESGSLRSDFSSPYRKFDFSLNTINESDRAELQDSLRLVGLRRDFFLSMFPDCGDITKEKDYSAIVKLVKTPKFTEFQQNYYKAKYQMEEV